jgi:uncharacterized protein (DUF302 family)
VKRRKARNYQIFLVRDHGAILRIAGKTPNALQYDIGNPITASLMTRHQLSAALYAPIRVVLYENDAGRGVFEYDQPSTMFGQFGDERVTAVARGLDAALARALLGAAN